jgi:hypothetical protein
MTSVDMPQRNEPVGSPWVSPLLESHRVEYPAVRPERDLPAYDMENFPDDAWGAQRNI